MRSGATTLVDAGSAGPGNFHGFRAHVIERTPVRILPYLNISFAGIFAFSKSVMVGECSDVRLLDARECLEVAERHRDLIVGIKVRVGRNTSEGYGVFPLELAIEVAQELGLPVMAHIDFPPPSRKDMLDAPAPGRRADPLLPAVPQRAGGPRRGPARDVGGARARRDLRHRPRHGRLRLRLDPADAGGGLLPGRDQQRRPHPVRARAGLRPPAHDVQAALPRHAARRGDPRRDRAPGRGAPPARPRHARAGRGRRRHDPRTRPKAPSTTST